jgi:ABC-type Fe3+/spermidine/putrescine transport system ATPase subunit
MIAVEGLGITRGVFNLSTITFAVPAGSYAVLMGPSGAGKTLLLETIAGFYPPSGGTVTVGGVDVTLDPPEKRRIGFAYQDYSLFPHLTVEGNVSFGLRMASVPSRERKETVYGLLARFNILSLAGRYPGTLSGGEKQRVALARALATRPAVLLLDEPFAALDPDTRSSCMQEVKTLQQETGLTILQVSHARDEAYLLADQVLVMDKGVLLQSGRPSEVFSHPAHRTVASIAGFENVLEGTAEAAGGGMTRLIVGGGILASEGVQKTGQRYFICIRAGDIALTREETEKEGAGSTIDGRVASVTTTDQGSRLRVEAAFPLTVDVSRHLAPFPGFRNGDRVVARIDPGDVHLIPVPAPPRGESR